jgi:hypothetical protein
MIGVAKNPVAESTKDGSQPNLSKEQEFQLERYKYILQRIHTVNENVYRFLAIYQALAVALVSGGVALFVGYRKWNIPVSVARSGVIGLMGVHSRELYGPICVSSSGRPYAALRSRR